MMSQHETYMGYAFKEAEMAYEKGEIPVGCIIVFQNSIIAKAHNQVETLKDPTAHAEILAITSAAAYLQSKQLAPPVLGCRSGPGTESCVGIAPALYSEEILCHQSAQDGAR